MSRDVFEQLSRVETDRIAVVGMGAEGRGDDAAGLEVARRLDSTQGLRAIEGGVAPENFTGVVRDFEPTLIVLVDAIEFGGEPGDVEVIDPDDLRSGSVSSHTPTPSMLLAYLEHETGGTAVLVGIQPATIDPGDPLSPAVETAIEETVAVIERLCAVE